jgi:hypothetical protein
MPHNLGLWSPSSMEPVAEVLSSLFSSTAVNERHGDHMNPTSYSVCDPAQNVTRWDSHIAFDPLRTLWPTPSDRRPLFPLADQESGTLWHHSLTQFSVHPSAYSSHSGYSSLSDGENVTGPSIPHYPPYPSFSPTSPHFSSHPTSTGLLESDPRSHLAFYNVPRWDSAHLSLSRRRRAARAIEYDGLWIDEEELLKGLTEPDGKLIVHQCRWEEDHSPCPLWIRCDKSSINAHIQKWHGGKPGGDKFQVDCRWSTCDKTMLKESIARHIVTIHLGEVWECQGCGKEIVRNDAYGRHAVRSGFAACRTSGALITYSVDAREIDARAALDSGGRLLYAGA